MSNEYPHAPGWKRTDTSAAAADAIAASAKTVRDKAHKAILAAGERGLTAVELSDVLKLDRMTVQPRTSELRALGLIHDSGQRRANPGGKRAIVWCAGKAPEPMAQAA